MDSKQSFKQDAPDACPFNLDYSPPTGHGLLCMGFYPTHTMWIGKRPDPLPPFTSRMRPLAALMHQGIKYYAHDDLLWFVTRDGLVMLALAQSFLEREGLTADAAAGCTRKATESDYTSMSKSKMGRKWSLHLDYLNTVHLLLVAAREKLLKSMDIGQLVGEVTPANTIVFACSLEDPLHHSVPLGSRFI